jgi:hypothetical protein
MKEQQLIAQIKSYLQTIPNLFFWKEHGGIYGTAGIPDIIICHNGKFIALECKVNGRKSTQLQQATIDKIQKADGIAAVVYSVEEVKKIIF